MEYIVSLIWIAIEVLYYQLLLFAFLSAKKKKRELIFTGICTWLTMFAYSNLGLGGTIRQCLTIGILFATAVMLYNGPLLKKLIAVVLTYVFPALMDSLALYGISALLGISLADLVWKKIAYIATVSMGKLISLFISWMFFQRKYHWKIRQSNGKWLLLASMFPVISVFVVVSVFFSDMYRSENDLSGNAVVLCLTLVIANVGVLYLIRAIEKGTIREQENVVLTQRLEMQMDSIFALEKRYSIQRKEAHEFAHHLQTISGLLRAGNINDAKEYLDSLGHPKSTILFHVKSNHPVIDVVFSEKYEAAKEKGIAMHIQVNDLAGISIRMDLLVVLLTNLLDNAIEACLKIREHREIICKMVCDENIYLSVANTSCPVEINGSFMQTDKAPRYEHGYGLPAIYRVMNELNAEYAYDYSDGWLHFAAEIPIHTSY